MIDHFHIPLMKGCFTGAGLIIAIGAQNAFVLKQGLMKNQVFVTALFCSLADALLITLGVGGLGVLLTKSKMLLLIAKWGGIAFLFWYGLRAFRAVFKSQSLQLNRDIDKPSLTQTLWTLSALTFLNPHVYIDAVVLLGSIGSTFDEGERPFFTLGAILASFMWFFGLCYGARLLAPLFESAKAWKVLDFFVGCIMWGIAASLFFNFDAACS